MVNRIKIISATAIVLLFVSALSAATVYYNGALNDKNSKIASLNTQIASQNSEIANLDSQLSQETNLTNPYLVTTLGVKEIGNWDTGLYSWGPYYRLFIQGTAFNIGKNMAFNAGLKVVAYSNVGKIAINMTVPLANGYNYGTDTSIISGLSQLGSMQLGNLTAGGAATVNLDIYHEGVVVNWTVTPVWTNTP